MKYAVINEKGRILRISEEEPKHISEGKSIAEITDEQAEQVEASSKPLFLIEKELLTFTTKLWKEQPETVKESLRPKRDRLLAESDWTQLNDTNLPEETISAWAAYRQNLRDLTDNINTDGTVTFPTPPAL